jgi:hypothetical protein
MTITFRAASMHVRQDEDHALLGLSDHNAFPTHYLVFMRGLRPRAGIAEEVTESPYLEYASKDQAGFGCIKNVQLKPHRLAIRVDRRTCPALPDTEFVVELDGNMERMGKIADLLRRILGDAARLTISAA